MTRLAGFTFAAILFSLLSAPQATADSVTLYHVVGTITINGNNTCTPAPCRELVDVAFDFGYQDKFVQTFPQLPPILVTHYVPILSNLETHWTGPIGNFTTFIVGPRGFSDSTLPPFVGMSGQFGSTSNFTSDELDITLFDGRSTVSDNPAPPSILPPKFFAELFWCLSAECRANILSAGQSPNRYPASFTYTVTAVPEPPTFALLGFGIIGVVATKLKKRIKE